MAGVQGWALAAAVHRAGGLGAIPSAQFTKDGLVEEIGSFFKACGEGAPLNVNFFVRDPVSLSAETQEARHRKWRTLLAPIARDRLHLTAKETEAFRESRLVPGFQSQSRLLFDASLGELTASMGVKVVSFHFGLPPKEELKALRAKGVLILASATTVEEGLYLKSQKVDGVIAQGWEAGGHRSNFLGNDHTFNFRDQLGTLTLTSQMLRALGPDTPVIATGGIADANQVRALLSMGCAAVQVGTSFMLCTEAKTSAVHRAAMKNPRLHGKTVLTNVYTGRLARAVDVEALPRAFPSGVSRDVAPFPDAALALNELKAYCASNQKDAGYFTAMFNGQNLDGQDDVSAETIVERLVARL